MTVAQPSPHFQSLLFDLPPNGPILSTAHARNAYGKFAEELCCAALSLSRISIDGSKQVCFDATDGERFFEIKSCHRNGKLVLYKWRLAKEEAFEGLLCYCILVHRARGCKTLATLRASMQQFELWIVESSRIRKLAREAPLKFLSKLSSGPRNGYSRKGYREGYHSVPIGAVRKLAGVSQDIRVELYGEVFEGILRN